MALHDKQKLIFTDLPNEIQFKILHFTYEPRIIVLDWAVPEHWKLNIQQVNTPVALHINQNLRIEAQRDYELLEHDFSINVPYSQFAQAVTHPLLHFGPGLWPLTVFVTGS
ncbi:hypothetical protein GLAREA_00970 [Glarea lozoyensis ATCC 20868]|uniref:2EXR domain-containing protein n=1 Tax=Glarea lozoyensis (strain ATCC 20868 / MF5171) TaxID=1116229 RepID=S3CW22_GLAL2|nr:uncharacterized protein GLAREA_00970 [Glarea lozoyensis ATCC 20868]EPE29810.1 hypothetical protein GLAREA_00970 [Glarea lozoyensis ATCC 20868]